MPTGYANHWPARPGSNKAQRMRRLRGNVAPNGDAGFPGYGSWRGADRSGEDTSGNRSHHVLGPRRGKRAGQGAPVVGADHRRRRSALNQRAPRAPAPVPGRGRHHPRGGNGGVQHCRGHHRSGGRAARLPCRRTPTWRRGPRSSSAGWRPCSTASSARRDTSPARSGGGCGASRPGPVRYRPASGPADHARLGRLPGP